MLVVGIILGNLEDAVKTEKMGATRQGLVDMAREAIRLCGKVALLKVTMTCVAVQQRPRAAASLYEQRAAHRLPQPGRPGCKAQHTGHRTWSRY